MPDREAEKGRADQRTATHGGDGGQARDAARPEPGSGLDRRQERNGTEADKGDDGQGAHTGKTNPANP